MDWRKTFGFARQQEPSLPEKDLKTPTGEPDASQKKTSKYKDMLKHTMQRFNHTYKTDDDKLKHCSELFDQIKSDIDGISPKDILDSQLDMKGFGELALKILTHADTDSQTEPGPLTIQILVSRLDQMQSCLSCFNQVAKQSADYLWSSADFPRFLKTMNALVWKLSHSNQEIISDAGMDPQLALDKTMSFALLVAEFFELSENRNENTKSIDLSLMYKICVTDRDQEPFAMVWKLSCALIISAFCKSDRYTEEIMQWTLESGMYSKSIQLLEQAVQNHNKMEALAMLHIVSSNFVNAHQKNETFHDQFREKAGYKLLIQVLEMEHSLEHLQVFLKQIPGMMSIGNEQLYELLDSNMPFQSDGFQMPPFVEKHSFKNLDMIPVYRHFFTKSCDKKYVSRQTLICQSLLDFVQLNRCNYFLVCAQSSLMVEICEAFPKLHHALGSIVLKMLKYTINDLQYTPFKELMLLFSQLQTPSQIENKLHCLDFCLEVVRLGQNWVHRVSDLGLVSLLTEHLVFIKDAIVSKTPLHYSLVASFNKTMELLTLLIFDQNNQKTFRSRITNEPYLILEEIDLRSGGLRLIKHLCIQSTMKTNTDLVRLIDAIPKADYLLKIQLLKILEEVLNVSATCKTIFRQSKGFDNMCEILEHTLDLNLPADLAHAAFFIEKWCNVMISSLQASTSNQAHFTSQQMQFKILHSIQPFYNTSIQPLVAGCLFSIMLEDRIFINTFSEDIHKTDYSHLHELCAGFDIHNAGALIVLLQLMKAHPDQQTDIFIFHGLLALVDQNKKNQYLLSNHEVFRELLFWLTNAPAHVVATLVPNGTSDSPHFAEDLVLKVSTRILQAGISNAEMRILFQQTIERKEDLKTQFFMELVLFCLTATNSPPYFQFEGKTGQGYLHIGDYERSFPPLGGYTFMSWIKVESVDQNAPLYLMSIQDMESKPLLQLSIEHPCKLRLKTVKGSYVFNADVPLDKWVHIALVHQKPRIAGSSTAAFYINGKLQETAKCSYMGHPGSAGQVNTYLGSMPQIKGLYNANSFQMGPTYLFEEHLLEAPVISVVYEIGFEYTGSWQGSWSKYLIGNELLRTKAAQLSVEEAQSPIGKFNYVMSQGKHVIPSGLNVPSEKILISLCASNSVNSSHGALATEVLNATGEGRIVKKASVVTLHGNVITVVPKRLVDSLWTLGGCAILLKMVEISDAPDSLYRSLSVLEKCLKQSWRLAAEMENGQFYEILSSILRDKREYMNFSIMDILMQLVGRSLDNTEDATVSNSSALRYLFLDIELWRTTKELQRYYLSQLSDMVIYSSKKDENVEKLNDLSIIKRFVLMLKSQIIFIDNLSELMYVWKVFLKDGWSPEIAKSLCSYMISTLPPTNDYSEMKSLSNSEQKTAIFQSKVYETKSYEVQTRNRILETLLELMQQDYEGAIICNDIIRHVSPKWISMFWGPRVDCYTCVLATKFYCRMRYLCKDSMNSWFPEGPTVLGRILQPFYGLMELYPLIMYSIAGLSIQEESTDLDSVCKSLERLKVLDETKVQKTANPNMVVPLISLISNGCRTVIDSKPNQEIETLSKVLECVLTVLSQMYHNLDMLKTVMCKKENTERLLHILIHIISLGESFSVEKELQFLNAAVENSLVLETLFKSRADSDAQLKVTVRFYGTNDTGESCFSIASKSLIGSLKGNKDAPKGYFGLTNTPGTTVNGLEQTMIDSLIEVIMAMSVDSILGLWSPMTGLEAILKSIPPSSNVFRSNLIEFLLLLTMDSVNLKTTKKPSLIGDYRTLPNLLKLVTLIVDEIYHGLFSNQATMLTLDFVIGLLERLNDTEETNKSGSTYSINSFWKQLNRLIVYHFGNITHHGGLGDKQMQILDKIVFHKKLIFSPKNVDSEYFKCIFHNIFQLVFSNDQTQKRALDLFKILLIEKPSQVYALLKTGRGQTDCKDLVDGFSKVLFDNTDNFIDWLKAHKEELDAVLQETAVKSWETVQNQELKNCRDAVKTARIQRATRIKKLYKRIATENETVNGFIEKSRLWASEMKQSELSKHRKFKQDYQVMQASINAEWLVLSDRLATERALWGSDQGESKWMLDFTEGKSRIRKKLRVNKYVLNEYKSKEESKSAKTTEPPVEIVSPEQPESELLEDKSVWSMTSALVEENLEDEDQETPESVGAPEQLQQSPEEWEQVAMKEDQNRKIARMLQSGDEIIEIVNSGRLIGLELCEGLSIICKRNFYIIDNYFQRSDGEIIEMQDVMQEERNIYHWIVTNQNHKNYKSSASPNEYHACRKCSYEDIREVHKRSYLFRNVALEMFMSDGRNFFLTFFNSKSRDTVYNRLLSKASLNNGESVAGVQPSPGQLQSVFGGSPLGELTQKWINREISNFSYLMHLNTLAGRSYNDLTQYPTFPWILADYESEQLNLDDPNAYRDLSKPMGAQGERRAKEFDERFKIWDDPTIPGCHYGTHYSSSMIVCSFLIRLEPFTREYLNLQGGAFDHTDRLFHSIPTSWASASRLNTTDVRELIPEFFYLPEFLRNTNNYDFGRKQTGELVDNVILPKWAKNDTRLFIQMHRLALESDYVSDRLHQWIDLVFGYKQQGEEAAKALNVFHYLSYEGAVDIEKIEDPIEKQATIGIVHNFGQTPKQLFKKPHPKRKELDHEVGFAIQNDCRRLIKTCKPLRWLNESTVSDIKIIDKNLVCVGPSACLMPPNYQKCIDWFSQDHTMRLVTEGKTIATFEHLHIGQINCAAFASHNIFVTGGMDTNVCVWSYHSSKKQDLDSVHCMRAHQKPVTCLAISRSFSVIVSGGQDNICVVWDLNRYQYVRTLKESGEIVSVGVNDNSGDIISATRDHLSLWSINGELICSVGSQNIATVQFLEGRTSEVFFTKIIASGHTDGTITLWEVVFDEKWQMRPVQTLEQNQGFAISHLHFSSTGRFLLAGDTKGHVFGYMLPDGSGTEMHYQYDEQCTTCAYKFAVLDRRTNCRACGMTLCNNCIKQVNLQDKGLKLCTSCGEKVTLME